MSKPFKLMHTLLISHIHTHSDPDKFRTTSNEAYNTVVGGRTGSGEVRDSQYELPQVPPGPTLSTPSTPSSCSSRPVSAASDYI